MPSTSGPQHRAMEAAAHGKSELGIPASVGKDFEQADKGKSFKDAQLRAFCDGVEKLAKRLDSMDCGPDARTDSFDEGAHPRSSNGQFGSGGGGKFTPAGAHAASAAAHEATSSAWGSHTATAHEHASGMHKAAEKRHVMVAAQAGCGLSQGAR